jgi:hypothetical protein
MPEVVESRRSHWQSMIHFHVATPLAMFVRPTTVWLGIFVHWLPQQQLAVRGLSGRLYLASFFPECTRNPTRILKCQYS